MNSVFLGGNLAVAKTKFGSKIFLDTRDRQVAPHLLLDGEWEGWMTAAIIPYLQNAVFFDVGANYGWYTVVAHHARARHIVAIEPNSYMFGLLSDTLQVNGIRAERVKAAAASLGGQEIPLWIDTSCPGSSTCLPLFSKMSETYSPMVRTVTLDDLWQNVLELDSSLGRAPVTLKIDVEGFEPMVVAGAQNLLARREVAVTAFVEHHQDPRDSFGFRGMFDFFEEQGFTLNLVEHDESIRKIARDQLDRVPDAEMLCFRRISG